ncbi:antibiotic biosynthesis monooxygenase [Streptomyces sp. NPDC050848]|uniref:putative quinol monooxygenase n=1 Tax=Streptomyces sp. NPDC050848 TaxID=3155791 RepID=UPI0034073A93
MTAVQAVGLQEALLLVVAQQPDGGARCGGNLQYHLHEHEDGRFFLYEVWRSQEDLDQHNATPPLAAFLGNLSTFLEDAPEGYFDTMLSPYPEAEPVPA